MNQALSRADAAAVAQRFAHLDRLTVRQRKKWTEILLNFEMKNSYQVYDGYAQAAFEVKEVGEGFGDFIRRLILGPFRPFTAHVIDSQSGEILLRVERRFRFVFHVLEVYAGGGQRVGSIERRWSWIRRIYEVRDDAGRAIAELFGPFLRPWTFEIQTGGRTLGMIQKRWSGLGKELFTDADNFGVELGNIPDPRLRALAFAATVLIDVVHFERAKQ